MIKKFALFLIALLPVGLMAQEVKLGHVNSQEILSIMPERVEIEKQLNQTQTDWENELLKMREEYNGKVKKFVDEQATMSETIKQARQTEIADIEQRITTLNQTAQNDLVKKQQELTAPMIEKVKKAIDAVGAEGGYTYIFDVVSQAIVYQSPKANDVTPLVKKKLGLTGTTTTKPATTTPSK
ncbi:Outer membrane chaperone Skp (OmpH) [uncultured Paludibacter sp.]|nr:Outer membrane chaperone Skp (OmpH) [uncultured Paludibacter sp.]